MENLSKGVEDIFNEKDLKIKKLKKLLQVMNDALLEANERLRKNGLAEVRKSVDNIIK